jgi:ribosome recycling factor
MQLAAEQQEVSNSLEHEHLPDLQKLRKECRDKIQKLKADQSLSADELLRRAELTRAKMTHLDRCCKQADKATGQVEMDPWVANLCLYTSFFFF